MRVRLVRKMLAMVVMWAISPALAVFGHSVLLPDRVGQFEEQTGPVFAQAGRGPHVYSAPDQIGTIHQFDVGPVMGLGTPEPRSWYGFGPTSGAPRPVVVLLHGAGRTGASMIDMWHDLAKRQHIVLVAPDARGTHWSLVSDGPMFLGALLQEAAQRYTLDPDRIYLAGHSDGGMHAMRIANLGGGPFKAVATHSGHSKRFRMIPALTPVPVHSVVGDADTVFTVESSRNALQHLARAGHPTSLTVIPNHTHWYYGIGPRLAPLMWQRLTDHPEAVPAPDTPEPELQPQIVQRGESDQNSRMSGAKWIRVTPVN